MSKKYLQYVLWLRYFIGMGFYAVGYYGFKYIENLKLTLSLIISSIAINIGLSNISGFVLYLIILLYSLLLGYDAVNSS